MAIKMELITGVPEFGLWCERCALPSAVRLVIYQLDQTGMSPVATVTRCLEGGHA